MRGIPCACFPLHLHATSVAALRVGLFQALIAALNEYAGGVVVVSHDSHLLSCVADEIYTLDKQTKRLLKFHGDFMEYRKQLLRNVVH